MSKFHSLTLRPSQDVDGIARYRIRMEGNKVLGFQNKFLYVYIFISPYKEIIHTQNKKPSLTAS